MTDESNDKGVLKSYNAEILVPDSIFHPEWSKQSGCTERMISELGKRFVCSRFVLLRKALDTGKIDQKEYGRLLNLFQKQFKAAQDRKQDKGSGEGDFYRTLRDQRFC